MRRMSAKDAKTRFGELLLEAQKGPVTIEKNGKPVAVLYSMERHEAVEARQLEWLRERLAEARADVAAGRVHEIGGEDEHRAFFEGIAAEAQQKEAEDIDRAK